MLMWMHCLRKNKSSLEVGVMVDALCTAWPAISHSSNWWKHSLSLYWSLSTGLLQTNTSAVDMAALS